MDGSADGMYGNNGMFGMNNMNGMPGQFGFGFSNQGNFNNGMGFNGMNPMNGMPNMMGNGAWNNMNPMGRSRTSFPLAVLQLTILSDFNNMNMPNMANGMYGGFGGNMMPGMNDMSMMNYGGGYGNGWQGGMDGSYGNFNGYNPMGGYNQSGAQYPQMMNQFPKNNFQNQNRFPANGTAFSQQKDNRRGSQGNSGNQNNGPAFQQNAHSRPESRSGPPHNVRRFHKESSVPPAYLQHPFPQSPKTDVSAPIQRDGESPAGDAKAATEIKVEREQTEASAEPAQEGKVETVDGSGTIAAPAEQAGGAEEAPNVLTRAADDANNAPQTSGLNQIQTIQTIDSMVDADPSTYEQRMMNDGMHTYPQGMMGDFAGPGMNGPYNGGMGYHQNTNYGHSGGYNPAYGAATVLTGEPEPPRGVGVVGAPTGPRAMREGRPNTGFSSRANNIRFNSHTSTPSVAPTQASAVASPPRRGRA